MAELSAARRRFALFALALGGFGIGTTEFVAMGLLPEISRDLLPRLAAAHPADAIAQTGAMVSSYALGVVVGAPTIAALAARFPRKRLLMVLAVAFTVGTVLSALAPTFPLVLAARFVAGLPHGAYFGVASLVAASLMGPGKRGQGVAMVLSGLTIANVVGVPAVTFVGQHAGWRAAYLIVAGVFALTTVAIAVAVPHQPGDMAATLRRELAAFGRPQVWFALAVGAIGFGGFFAIYSYISPLTTSVAGLPIATVPLSLVVVGLGMTLGNQIGGRVSDRGPLRAILILMPVMILAMVGLALTSSNPVGLYVFLFLFATISASTNPAIQTRLMDVAGESQTIAAALNHSALNIGNSLGAALGGAVIAAGFGYVAPTWVGVALAILGVAIAWASLVAQRRTRRLSGGEPLERPGGRVLDEDAVLDSPAT